MLIIWINLVGIVVNVMAFSLTESQNARICHLFAIACFVVSTIIFYANRV